MRFLPLFESDRGCKVFGGGYTFLVFYCIFINKFCKKFGDWVHFFVCIYGYRVPNVNSIIVSYPRALVPYGKAGIGHMRLSVANPNLDIVLYHYQLLAVTKYPRLRKKRIISSM
jgi:hypothetical protein